jgi:hypothetical protein
MHGALHPEFDWAAPGGADLRVQFTDAAHKGQGPTARAVSSTRCARSSSWANGAEALRRHLCICCEPAFRRLEADTRGRERLPSVKRLMHVRDETG